MFIRCYRKLGNPAVLAGFLATTALAGTAVAADLPVKAPPAAPWFSVNDNSVSFTWYPDASDPNVTKHTDRFQGNLTHFDVFKYGTNFIDLSYAQYGKSDPVLGVPGAAGNAEAIALVRNTLSFNALSGTKTFDTFFTKDVAFAYGGFFEVENNQLAPEEKMVDLGINFALKLPGTVNLAIYAQKEWGYNSFYGQAFGAAPGFTGDRIYKWAFHPELQISEPLTFLPIPLTWNSFTALNGPKGTGISQANFLAAGPGPNGNNINTKTEIFADNRLTLDAGKLAFGKAGIWETYVGYRYWYNKFGTDSQDGTIFATLVPGSSIESTAYVGTTYHFK